jgi:hypothetical protein
VCTTTNLESTVLLEEQTAKKQELQGAFSQKRRQSRALPPASCPRPAAPVCFFIGVAVSREFRGAPAEKQSRSTGAKNARAFGREGPHLVPPETLQSKATLPTHGHVYILTPSTCITYFTALTWPTATQIPTAISKILFYSYSPLGPPRRRCNGG